MADCCWPRVNRFVTIGLKGNATFATMKSLLLLFFPTVFLLGCTEVPAPQPVSTPASTTMEKHPFVLAVERAHALERFQAHPGVAFNLDLHFGGRQILDARLTLSTDSRYAQIDYADGRSLLVRDDEVLVAPDTVATEGLRFSAYTWPYFFLFPYKMSDNGTHWESTAATWNDSLSLETAKLTFAPGTGDAPDDWYIGFAHPDNHLLHAAAYIVTAGQSVQEAEADPHAIEYLDYQTIQGVPIAHSWKFWEWRESGTTRTLGHAQLTEVTFVDASFKTAIDVAFARESGVRTVSP